MLIINPNPAELAGMRPTVYDEITVNGYVANFIGALRNNLASTDNLMLAQNADGDLAIITKKVVDDTMEKINAKRDEGSQSRYNKQSPLIVKVNNPTNLHSEFNPFLDTGNGGNSGSCYNRNGTIIAPSTPVTNSDFDLDKRSLPTSDDSSEDDSSEDENSDKDDKSDEGDRKVSAFLKTHSSGTGGGTSTSDMSKSDFFSDDGNLFDPTFYSSELNRESPQSEDDPKLQLPLEDMDLDQSDPYTLLVETMDKNNEINIDEFIKKVNSREYLGFRVPNILNATPLQVAVYIGYQPLINALLDKILAEVVQSGYNLSLTGIVYSNSDTNTAVEILDNIIIPTMGLPPSHTAGTDSIESELGRTILLGITQFPHKELAKETHFKLTHALNHMLCDTSPLTEEAKKDIIIFWLKVLKIYLLANSANINNNDIIQMIATVLSTATTVNANCLPEQSVLNDLLKEIKEIKEIKEMEEMEKMRISIPGIKNILQYYKE